MHPQKKTWLAINAVGGAAVLGSYVHGLLTHPETRNELWGSIPPELQAVYGVTMWLAAGGYFFFSYYFLLRTEAERLRIKVEKLEYQLEHFKKIDLGIEKKKRVSAPAK